MLLCLILWLAGAAAAAPDLILSGGKAFLGPGRYAQAVAVTGNRITAVGSDKEILALKGPGTKLVALKGRSVTPGFHDAYAHLLGGGLAMTQVDVSGASTIPDIQKRLTAFAAENPGTGWIVGRGWDVTALPGQAYPSRYDLDAAISSRPVALTDAGGGKLWMNSEALKRANISSSLTKRTKSGIMVDGKGEPTGILLEEAMSLGHRVLPQIARQDRLDALRRGLDRARRAGVTSVDWLADGEETSPEEQLEFWRELYKNKETTLRYFIYGRLDDVDAIAKLRKKAKDIPRDRLDFVGVSATLDGPVADRKAALLAPYYDEPKTSGALRHAAILLNLEVRKAHQQGLQVALEASGDKAVRQALDACEKSQEKAKQEEQILPPHPCRISRIETADRAELGRFSALGAVAAMAPGRLVFEEEAQNYLANRLGERVRYCSPWASLQKAGALLVFASDWPASAFEPRLALFAATTRETAQGKPAGGWIPQEKIGLEQAIVHYTLDPARAIGRDDVLGEIAPGRLADLAVFDRDLLETRELDLLKIGVDITIFDGKIVFDSSKP